MRLNGLTRYRLLSNEWDFAVLCFEMMIVRFLFLRTESHYLFYHLIYKVFSSAHKIEQ